MTRGLRMKRKLPSFDIKFINIFVNELNQSGINLIIAVIMLLENG